MMYNDRAASLPVAVGAYASSVRTHAIRPLVDDVCPHLADLQTERTYSHRWFQIIK
jgi:hypothetical protein